MSTDRLPEINGHELTDEDIKKLNEFADGIDKEIEAKKLEDEHFVERETDYVMRRKIIWKGQTAPLKCVYICIYLKAGKDSKYTAAQLIMGNQGKKYEADIADALRESIRKKFSV